MLPYKQKEANQLASYIGSRQGAKRLTFKNELHHDLLKIKTIKYSSFVTESQVYPAEREVNQ